MLKRGDTVPPYKSHRPDAIKRTNSFRLAMIMSTPSDVQIVDEPVKTDTKDEKKNSLSSKIAHRRKPVRRPTSHVPKSDMDAGPDNNNDDSDDECKERSASLSDYDQHIMESKLRELAQKYRKSSSPAETGKSRIPVMTSSHVNS